MVYQWMVIFINIHQQHHQMQIVAIGYTSQVNISQSTNLALNASASYLTITLPYAGTYECSASVCLQYSCDYIYICII